MKTLVPGAEPEAFFRRLEVSPATPLLLLDYDGTLAPFHVDPSQALPYPGVCPLLDAILGQSRTRLVLISGRRTSDLLPLLALHRRPEVWGSHGWERLTSEGDYRVVSPAEGVRGAPPDAEELTARVAPFGGRVESKPIGLAIHWRGLTEDQVAGIRRVVADEEGESELEGSWAWRDFDGGLELRPSGWHKGSVVTTLLQEVPGAVAAYLGDDLTDEDAFRAIKGKGLGVLVRERFRATEAEVWLRPPEELLDFLRRWRDATGERR